MNKSSYAKLVTIAFFVTVAFIPLLAQPACPNIPTVDVTQPRPPLDVCIPTTFPSTELPIRFFDDFSWKSFIALIWPAKSPDRGEPDTARQIGSDGPLVFETYKSLAEVFHSDASTPTSWDAFDTPAQNACNQQLGFGDLVLASFSKFSNIGQAGFGNLQGPLIAQNQTYVRYSTAFNKLEFSAILAGKWFIKDNIPASGITFPNGAIDIKAAWVDMANRDSSRFYTRLAWVQEPATGICSQKKVGLVGLHIVQKTPGRPQWIWSSFEQIDNVPDKGVSGPFTFNDGTSTLMPKTNPYPLNPIPQNVPAPFNVQRIMPVHDSTGDTNTKYEVALAGTIWRFYKLVTTQWPVCNNPPCDPSMRGKPENTFPGKETTSAFANTTMETFEQGKITSGCMACHNLVQTVAEVQKGTDFVWTLRNHAATAVIPNITLSKPTAADKETRALLEILRTSSITSKQAQKAQRRSATTKNK